MEIALAIVAGMVVAIVGLLSGYALRSGPSLVGKTVVIHTRKPDDRTLRGTLYGKYGDRWTLRDAVAVMPGGREVALGGVEHIPVENISFAQEVETAA